VARPVERDLEHVLADLAVDFPLLASLVERHRGGQGRLPGAGRGPSMLAPAATTQAPAATTGPETAAPEALAGAGNRASGPAELTPPEVATEQSRGGSQKRPGRYGLAIDFEHRPDDPEPARLVESTVWINVGHPAYRRAVASRSEGYHLALATALALGPLAVEPAKEHAFVTAFLTAWGEAIERRPRRGRRA
jgi:hypothetical protein